MLENLMVRSSSVEDVTEIAVWQPHCW